MISSFSTNGSAPLLPAITSITAAPGTTINEGDTITITITTENIADGETIWWANTGTTVAGDFTSGYSPGFLTVNNNTASMTLIASEDYLTEGQETLQVDVYLEENGGGIALPVSITIAVVDSSLSPSNMSISNSVSAFPCAPGGGDLTIQIAGGNPNYTVEIYSGGLLQESVSGSTNSYIFTLSPGDYTATITDTPSGQYSGSTQTTGTITIPFVTGMQISTSNININSGTISVSGGTGEYTLSMPGATITETSTGVWDVTNLNANSSYSFTVSDDNCSVNGSLTTLSNLLITVENAGQLCGENYITSKITSVSGGQGPYTLAYYTTDDPNNPHAIVNLNDSINLSTGSTYYAAVTDSLGNVFSLQDPIDLIQPQNTTEPNLVFFNASTDSLTIYALDIDSIGSVSISPNLNGETISFSGLQINASNLQAATSYSITATSNAGCSSTANFATLSLAPNITVSFDTIGHCDTEGSVTVTSNDPNTSQYAYPYTVSASSGSGIDAQETMFEPGCIPLSGIGVSDIITINVQNSESTPGQSIYGSFPIAPQYTTSAQVNDTNITVSINGSTGAYQITLYNNGAIHGFGTIVPDSGSYTFNNLPDGTYTYTVEDRYGCGPNGGQNTTGYQITNIQVPSFLSGGSYNVDTNACDMSHKIMFTLGPTNVDYFLKYYIEFPQGTGLYADYSIDDLYFPGGDDTFESSQAHAEAKSFSMALPYPPTNGGGNIGNPNWKIEVWTFGDSGPELLSTGNNQGVYYHPRKYWPFISTSAGNPITISPIAIYVYQTITQIYYYPEGVLDGSTGFVDWSGVKNYYEYPYTTKLFALESSNNNAASPPYGDSMTLISEHTVNGPGNFQYTGLTPGAHYIIQTIPSNGGACPLWDSFDTLPINISGLSVSATNAACSSDNGIATVNATFSTGADVIRYRVSSPYTGSWQSSNSFALNPGTYSFEVMAYSNANSYFAGSTNPSIVIESAGSATIGGPSPIAISNISTTHESITFTVSGGNGNYTPNIPSGSTLDLSNAPQYTISGLTSSTNYNITVGDTSGCGDTASSSISTLSCPSVGLELVSETPVSCNGAKDGSIVWQYDITNPNIVNSYTVTNSGGGGQTATQQISGSHIQIAANNLNPGTYTISLDLGGGCTQTLTGTVADTPALNAVITDGGLNTNMLTLSVSGGPTNEYTFEISPSGGTFTQVQPSVWSISGLDPGILYTVTVYSGDCVATASGRTVNIYPFYRTTASLGGDGSAWCDEPPTEVYTVFYSTAYPNSALNIEGRPVLDSAGNIDNSLDIESWYIISENSGQNTSDSGLWRGKIGADGKWDPLVAHFCEGIGEGPTPEGPGGGPMA